MEEKLREMKTKDNPREIENEGQSSWGMESDIVSAELRKKRLNLKLKRVNLRLKRKRQKQDDSTTSNGRDQGQSLCCSISITRDAKGLIIVSNSSYLPSSTDNQATPTSVDGCGKSPRKRRASFKLAQERLSYETNQLVNKENKKPRPPSPDVSVISIEAPPIGLQPHPPAEEGRLSNRRQSSDVTIVSVEAPPTEVQPHPPAEEEKTSCAFGFHLWNNLYRPKKSRDIIGNKEGVAKVHNWLLKWKTRPLREPEGGVKGDPLRAATTRDNTVPDPDPDFKVPSQTLRRRPRTVNLNESFNSSSCSN